MGTETTAIDLIKVLRETRKIDVDPRHNLFSPCFSAESKFARSEELTYGIDCDEVYPNIFIGDG